uniref:RING-type domain-containing protein n=1 Tax=Glossina brevipalpis TaxID=37001 RepID=A0A1A9WMA3_9MUSC
MTTTLGMTCSICMENFINSDAIYSTSCGHVFHHNCIQSWRETSTKCPMCRVEYGNMQKLYLNFDDNEVSTEKLKVTEQVNQRGAIKKERSPRINSVMPPKQRQKSSNFQNQQGAFGQIHPKIMSDNYAQHTKVVVKRYPSNFFHHPMVNLAIALGSIMDMRITVNDIREIRKLPQYHKNNHLPNSTISLLIQFRTLQLKINFLKNKSKLKNHSAYARVLIFEYMDDNTYSLFQYAKRNLKNHGFSRIFYQNGQIMASKVTNGPNLIHIKSKIQVDEIIFSKTGDEDEWSCAIS